MLPEQSRAKTKLKTSTFGVVILYINSNSIIKKGVDIKQSLNAVNSLSEFVDITYYSSWISNKDKRKCFLFFMLDQKFKHKRTPVKVITVVGVIGIVNEFVDSVAYKSPE